MNRIYWMAGVVALLCGSVAAAGGEVEPFHETQLFVMLNIDQTVLDRLAVPCNEASLQPWALQGLEGQVLTYATSVGRSPKFASMYEGLAKGFLPPGESEYMARVMVKAPQPGQYHVTECVVMRPAISYLFEQLYRMGMPMHILLTSRNDDARTQHLHDHLQFSIAGQSFQQATRFIPRDWFRLIMQTRQGEAIAVKSASALQGHMPSMHAKDVVVSLDYLESSRFIPRTGSQDFNVELSKFKLDYGYNQQEDRQQMDHIAQTIAMKLQRPTLPQVSEPTSPYPHYEEP